MIDSTRTIGRMYSMKFLLLIFLMFSPCVVMAQGSDGELEEGIVKVEVTGISSRDFFVRFSSDTLYLPFIQLCDYLRVIQSNSERLDTVRGEMPAGRPFFLTASGIIHNDSMTGSFPSSWYRVIDGEVYVRDSILAAALGIRCSFDLNHLALAIAPDSRIPLVSLKNDARRYKRLTASKQGEFAHGEERISITRSLFGGILLDWALNGTYGESVSGTDVRYRGASGYGSVGLSTPLLFGNLSIIGRGTYNPYSSGQQRSGLGSARWGVVLPELSWLTRFNLSADVSMYNEEGRLYQVEVNNIPLAGRDHLGFHDLVGETNPGWTVEMYDGLQLVEVTQADSVGRYRFNIPVGYGTIRRVIHSVGPHAERIVEERTLQFNQSLLPAGDIEYSIRGAAESLGGDSLIHGGMIVRAGVLPWLSLGVGSSIQMRPSFGAAALSDSLHPMIVADIWTGGVSSVGLRYNPKAVALWTTADWMPVDGLILGMGLDSLSFSDMTFAARAQGSYGTRWGYISVSGGYMTLPTGTTISAAPQFFTGLYGMMLGISTRLQWTSVAIENSAPSPESSIIKRMTSAVQLGSTLIPNCRLTLKGTYDHVDNALSMIAAQADIRLFSQVGIGLSYSVADLDWNAGSASVSLNVGLGGISTSITGTHSELERGYTTASNIQGGVLVSSAGLDFTRTTSSGQPQLIVRAFTDENDNGVWDGGESEMESPTIMVRQGTIATQGRDRLFLSPFRETRIEIDPGEFVSQGLFPSRLYYDIYTQPGTVQVITVPFSTGMDVTGTIEVRTAADGSRRITTSAINGLRVNLEALDGSAEYEGEVFSDGTLLVSGVRQGEYSISLDPDQLAQRRLAIESIPENVKISKETQVVPTLVLIPAPR